MRAIYFLLLLFLICSCRTKQTVSNVAPVPEPDSATSTDNFKFNNDKDFTGCPKFDSLPTNYFTDNLDLQRKRRRIREHFTNNIPSLMFDTLVDVNYDRYRDYLLGYYLGSGTGFKYAIDVYSYSVSRKDYILDKQLSSVLNPSFFLHQRKITGFYIGGGGGWGVQLEWKHNKWTATKTIDVDNHGDSTIWEITYPLTHKKDTIIMPFQGIPPEEVLEVNREF